MPEITNEQLEEYKMLRRRYGFDAIRASVLSCAGLEDDIDTPIKRVVMALALLGCEPLWSCCGFDYVGQPIHKEHQSERAWVVLRDNERTRWLAAKIIIDGLPYKAYANTWKVDFFEHYGDRKASLYSDIVDRNSWPDPDCIHFSEPGAISIQILEDFLLGLKDEMAETVTLADTNAEFRERYASWQYPPKAPWVICKSDLLAQVVNERVSV